MLNTIFYLIHSQNSHNKRTPYVMGAFNFCGKPLKYMAVPMLKLIFFFS